MKRLTALLASLLFISTSAFAQLKAKDYEWMNSIRTDHPRMFFTAEDIPTISNNALVFDERTFNTMQRRIDRLMTKGVVFKDELNQRNTNASLGYRTAEAALLWVIKKDKKYLDFTKMMLDRMVTHYDLRIKNNLDITWQSCTIVAVLGAYDWIYNDLTKEERADIGKRLYNATYNIAWHGKDIRPKRPRENNQGPTTSFLGTASLPWYIGLTFYGEGIDDEECENMLRNGYDLHQRMTRHRARLIGKGGSHSGTIGNGFDPYPYAEYNFIYTFRSATGIDPTPQMKYMLGYLRYFDWIRLPDNKEYGIGDSHHSTNKLPRSIAAHIREIANLFIKNDTKMYGWFASLLARYNDANSRPGTMAFLPLLHRYHFDGEEDIVVKDAKDKQSHHFTNIGQIVMRSGVGDKDTYAVFLTERTNRGRQHYDLNNFIIYKNGFRALDSGTRPQPGLHTSHYYGRTVAHNCITIRMPDEELPRYWGKPAKTEDGDTPMPNDGGQRSNRGGKLLAHEESADYVYIASDATKCYHQSKADQVVREFIWIKPDIFVIYDRVVSDKAEYPKRWLFHTAAEPIMSGKAEFSETSQGGKSICRTLLPKGAVIERIGGEGKQFWSDGQNWPIPVYQPKDPMYRRSRNIPLNTHPLVGQWRVEVSPKKAATNDQFLHIIQVGGENLESLPKTECKDGKESVVLKFNYAEKSYSLTFDKTKSYGCTIEVK